MTIVFTLLTMLMVPGFAGELTPHPNPYPAPSFQLMDTRGDVHRLSDYRGRVTVINFWASWCPPCVNEMPSLQRAWTQWREDGIQVLAINMGEPPEAIGRFMERYPMDFPVLMDRDVAVATRWGVKGLPVTFILDADGRVALSVIGDLEWDDPAILERVRALRKASSAPVKLKMTLLNHE